MGGRCLSPGERFRGNEALGVMEGRSLCDMTGVLERVTTLTLCTINIDLEILCINNPS